MGQICSDSGPTLRLKTWPLLKLSQQYGLSQPDNEEDCGLSHAIRDMGCKNRKTHWYEAVSSPLNCQFLKEVSQNCFVFDADNFGFWTMSRRAAAFLMLSPSKCVSQKSFGFQLATSKLQTESRKISTDT